MTPTAAPAETLHLHGVDLAWSESGTSTAGMPTLVLCRERPRGRTFVCFDKKLASAAVAAGFTVLPPI